MTQNRARLSTHAAWENGELLLSQSGKRLEERFFARLEQGTPSSSLAKQCLKKRANRWNKKLCLKPINQPSQSARLSRTQT